MSQNDDEKKTPPQKGGLMAEMILGEESSEAADPADLVVPPTKSPDDDKFSQELTRSLGETEEQVLQVVAAVPSASGPDTEQSWKRARNIVERFRPVPWFIWRLSNFVFSKSGKINKAPEGMVLGLRRLLFAAASDPLIGEGRKVNDMRKAMSILSSDVIAALGVIHAISKRLATRQFERIWRPILDDALMRAQLGYLVGEQNRAFGAGRGMLAGFAGRCGLAIIIAEGDLEQARGALEMLASGKSIKEVGIAVYKCDPLQVSAMALSASGCGRNAAFGTVSYSVQDSMSIIENDEQMAWLAAFTANEGIRSGAPETIDEKYWRVLNFKGEEEVKGLLEVTQTLIRNGHGWNWLM